MAADMPFCSIFVPVYLAHSIFEIVKLQSCHGAMVLETDSIINHIQDKKYRFVW